MPIFTPFQSFPFRFDTPQLAAEVHALPTTAWRSHPEQHAGNTAIALVAPYGDPTNDSIVGPMRPTLWLDQLPYVRQVLAALRTVIGRVRLLRVAPQAEVPAHVDVHAYWHDRVRVHVPIVTDPSITFTCGDHTRHLPAGSCWLLDTWQRHHTANPTTTPRIHLVIDTVGSADFWRLVEHADTTPQMVPFVPGWVPDLVYETVTPATVMPPGEQAHVLARLSTEWDAAQPATDELHALLRQFHWHWRALWAQHGDRQPHAYRRAVIDLRTALTPFVGQLTLPNGLDAVTALHHRLLQPALAPLPLTWDRPVFIVSAPRSGSTLLFETLARATNVATVGGESHTLIEGIPELHPAHHDYASNRLTAADANHAVVAELHARFADALVDAAGQPWPADAPIRLLEKTPKNALRLPFLLAAFPDARFLYLYRDPAPTLSSMLSAWRSGQFVTYPDLPDWPGPPWSLLLVPGWRNLADRPLAEIVAHQWCATQQTLLADLLHLPPDRWLGVTYDELTTAPASAVARIATWADWTITRPVPEHLPLARHTLTPPDPHKWQQHANELADVLPRVTFWAAECRRFLTSHSARRAIQSPTPGSSFDP